MNMVAILIVGMFIGMQSIAYLPLLVAQSISVFGLTEQLAAYLVAVQLGIAAVAGFTLSLRLHQLNWQRCSSMGIVFGVAGNLLSLAATSRRSVHLLFLARAVNGLGEGALLATINAVAASTARPLKSFGFMNVGFGILCSGAYLTTPRLMEIFGTKALFISMACTGSVGWLVVPVMPSGPTITSHVLKNAAARFSSCGWLALLGYTFFMVIAGGTWGFSQRVGAISAHLGTVALGKITSVAIIFNFFGPYLANALRGRWGWTVSLGLGCAAYIVVSVMFATLTSATTFALGVGLHMVVSSFMSTIAPSYFAQLDDTGQLAAAGSAIVPLGSAFGPGLVSWGMLFFPGYTAIGYLGATLLLASLVFFLCSVRGVSLAEKMLR